MAPAALAPLARVTAGRAAARPRTLGVGYTIAALGPLLAGLAHDLTGGWTATLLLLVAMYACELLVSVPGTRGWRAGAA